MRLILASSEGEQRMHCPKCGWTNSDDVKICANCQAELPCLAAQQAQAMPAVAQQAGVPTITDYLGWSIAVTVISALLGGGCIFSLAAAALGVVAIVQSVKANTKKTLGDYAGALQDAESAKTWVCWSAGICAVTLLLLVLFWIGYFAFIMTMIGRHGFN